MTSQEWNSLVEKTYGRRYDFQQQDDCKDRGVVYFSVPCNADDFKNDTVPEIVNHDKMGVSFSAWLQRDPKKPLATTTDVHFIESDIAIWWERNFYPHATMLINDLHAKGLLPVGKTAIDIDW